MKPPIRTKIQVSATKASANIKAAVVDDSSSGEYGDEIDEFIKKHIENEEREKKKEGVNRFSSTAGVHEPSDSEIEESEDGKPKKTPKQHLLESLQKLAD